MRAARFIPILSLLFVTPAALRAQAGSANTASDLDRLSRGEHVTGLPPADSVAPGARTIAAGSTVRGTVVARGPVNVFGSVTGSVVSLGGDVVLHPGGSIGADALSVGGKVVGDSGTIGGEIRTMASLPTVFGRPVTPVDARTPTQRTVDAVRLVAGCFVALMIVALGVVLFARPNLSEVVNTMETRFAAAFWYGLLGQVLLLPGLVVLLCALVVSIIGILLVPFAIVVYAIAAAGLVALGFLATARLVGGALYSGDTRGAQMGTFLTLMLGTALLFSPWLIAALLAWAPLAAMVLRAAGLAATWVAITLGLGAAIISRAGTHRRLASGTRPVELAAWQTPTPVAGVVAARRTAGSRTGA